MLPTDQTSYTYMAQGIAIPYYRGVLLSAAEVDWKIGERRAIIVAFIDAWEPDLVRVTDAADNVYLVRRRSVLSRENLITIEYLGPQGLYNWPVWRVI